ncbi:flagellar filament capping protein FliD [Rhodobacter sp. HX-7-19]|uniref:Flagellar hook-associated protein 2 n=1 Tax=Paragemmobacter kunshanensis TaxID=2583234 RepID=A0A6M1TXQ8_9RHOB|nr:flagellar filament capping protein FliD [Rhodobacter kunshanensis]NGQ90034.1 flagellar filament capping protein FliD [Rhodobacter kunshanensis]
MAVDVLTSLNKNGSGLNLRELSTTLATAETASRIKAQNSKVETAQLSISALGQVRSQLNELSAAVTVLRENPVLAAKSGNAGVGVTITDPSKISNTTMSVGVEQLATRQVLEFAGFTTRDALVGAGTMQIEIGAWYEDAGGNPAFAVNPESTVRTLDIPSGVTLEMLAETLDGLPGLSARVLDKGDGTFSLGVVSEPGAGSALRFTVNETVAGLGAFDTTATNETVQIQGAQDAVLSVDGIVVSRPTNTIDDLIPGAVLDITAPAGTETTISFSRDVETARVNMQALVEQLNLARKVLTDLSARGTADTTAGALAGDRLIEKLKTDLASLLSGPISGFGAGSKRLSDFGVATNRDGSLRLDAVRFEAAFTADPAAFDMVFSNRLSASTPGVEVSGTPGLNAKGGGYTFIRDAVTGEATLNGESMLGLSAGDARTQYILFSGEMAGLRVTVPDDLTSTEVRYGKSFLSSLETMLNTALSGGANSLNERESQLNGRVTEATDQITALEARTALIEKRYLSRFTAMETAIAGLKSTGAYLDNLVAQWNKSS